MLWEISQLANKIEPGIVTKIMNESSMIDVISMCFP